MWIWLMIRELPGRMPPLPADFYYRGPVDTVSVPLSTPSPLTVNEKKKKTLTNARESGKCDVD